MQALTTFGRFSGSVLVARDGHAIVQAGYGQADVEWDIPSGPETEFRIGSMTKQFTAMAILILQDRGKLRLSDPICRYVPRCPPAWGPVTIQELLLHTAGIPDYTDVPGFERTQSVPATPEQLVARFRDRPLRFRPGSRFEYSNAGYVLLGIIIERASGLSYERFLHDAILAPLGLTHTGVDHQALILPRRARGYAREGATLRNAPPIDPSVAYSAGALYSTVGDLLVWDEALYAGHLVSRAALEEMFTAHHGPIGYGWAIDSLFGRRMAHHNGEISGFVSNIARFPDQHVLVVVLSNREGTAVDNITRDLAAIVFGERYEMPHERRIVTLTPATLDRYVGTYRITSDIRLSLRRDGDRLRGRLSGGDTTSFILAPESETHFTSDTPPVDLLFALDPDGRVRNVTVNGSFTGVPEH